jgi:hypothetical protein
MFSEYDLIGVAVFGTATWAIYNYYWLRVAFCLIALAVWFFVSVAFPAYISWKNFAAGDYLSGAAGLALIAFLGFIWVFGLKGAIDWYRTQRDSAGGFWQRWNAE